MTPAEIRRAMTLVMPMARPCAAAGAELSP